MKQQFWISLIVISSIASDNTSVFADRIHYKEPGLSFIVTMDSNRDGRRFVNVDFKTAKGTLNYVSIGYTPKQLKDLDGNSYDSPNSGTVNFNLSGVLTPITSEVGRKGSRIWVGKPSFSFTESITSITSYEDWGNDELLTVSVNAHFNGTFTFDGIAWNSYSEYDLYRGARDWITIVSVPIKWTSGIGLASGSIAPLSVSHSSTPEPTSLVLVTLGTVVLIQRQTRRFV